MTSTGDGVPEVAVVGPFNGLMRMTLTPPVVNAARSRLVVVDGGEKADVVERWMLDDRSLPITRVRRTVDVGDPRRGSRRSPLGDVAVR